MITAKEARERYDVKHDPYTHKIDIFLVMKRGRLTLPLNISNT